MRFETSGIGPEELAAIQRDEFVYYTTIAYMQADATDWPALRQALLGALVAALGLWRPPTQPDPSSTWRANARMQRQALELLDRVGARYDPAINWAGFLLELWEHRHQLRQGPAVSAHRDATAHPCRRRPPPGCHGHHRRSR